MYAYFRVEKTRMERRRVAEASKGMGRPKVGGEFELLDMLGGAFGSGALRGGFSLVSWGLGFFGVGGGGGGCREEESEVWD